MRNFINRLMIVAIMAMSFATVSFASLSVSNEAPQKKEKKQKEKKPKKEKDPFDWTKIRPEKLSGTQEMDDYILYCDTIWERIQTYKDEITFFKLDTFFTCQQQGADTVMVIKITDQDGLPHNFSHTIKQGLETALGGTNILLDASLITLMATNAGVSITSNPLLVFGYTKCLKGGPEIVKLAYNEVKEIVEGFKEQSTELKKLKSSGMEGSTDQAIIMEKGDIEVDPSKYDEHIALGTSEGELPEDEYDMELKPIDEPEISSK